MVAQQTAVVVSVATAFTHGIRCAPTQVAHLVRRVLLLDATLLLLLLGGSVPHIVSLRHGAPVLVSTVLSGTSLSPPLSFPQVPALAAGSRRCGAQRTTGAVVGGGCVAHIAAHASASISLPSLPPPPARALPELPVPSSSCVVPISIITWNLPTPTACPWR